MTTAVVAERVHTAPAPAAIPSESAYADIDVCRRRDDGKRYELIDGQPVELPPMRVSHSVVAGTICRLFDRHIENDGLPFVAGVGAAFRLGMSRSNFRIPDLHVTALQRLQIDINNEPGVWEGFPDIAAEVISPTDAYIDVIAKARLYLRQGVAVVLLIDALHREVTVRQSDGMIRVLTADDTLELDPTLSGFSCRVADIFSDLDRMAAFTAGSA